MFIVNSYLLIPGRKITEKELNSVNIKDNFLRIEDYNLPLEDLDYIDGAMELSIDGKELINIRMWDHIEALWSYILNGIIEILSGKETFSVFFPDQPIPINFKINNSRKIITFSVNNKSITIGLLYFIDNIIEGARHFFKELIRIEPALKEGNKYYLEFLDFYYGDISKLLVVDRKKPKFSWSEIKL